MTQPMGMVDFFTMEAGEYLERLDGLVSPAGAPDLPEFYRIARALRGSALMAGQQQIAAAAAGIETLARSARDGTLAWEETHRQLAIRAVDDLKVLVRGIRNWTEAEDTRAQQIVAELERVTGATATVAPREPQELDAATRAFIAREGAAVGSALDQAARTLARNPMGVGVLTAVLRATQPLRGIASLSDLPPLPDLLDGIEEAVHEMMRRKEPMPNPGDIFDAAAKAISRVSQEIATAGRADPDSEEAGVFAAKLGALLEVSPDIVPIETLAPPDGGPHIVSEGAPQMPAEGPGQLEMVSLGEHLKQAADDLDAAQSNTQRQLRAHGLAPTLRTLEMAGPGEARFVRAVRAALAGSAAVSAPTALAAALREAGTLLSSWGQADPATLDQRLTPIADRLAALGPQPAAEPEPGPAAPDTSLAQPQVAEPPSPAAAAAQPPAAPVPPQQPAAPQPVATAPPVGDDWLADSYSAYHELMASGNGEAHLATVFAGGEEVPTAGGPTHPPADPEIRPITDYCYSGPAALRQAQALKERLAQALPEDHQDLLQEILDLIELGLRKSN
jgi:chemotaxis protein histidine kinase CheA